MIAGRADKRVQQRFGKFGFGYRSRPQMSLYGVVRSNSYLYVRAQRPGVHVNQVGHAYPDLRVVLFGDDDLFCAGIVADVFREALKRQVNGERRAVPGGEGQYVAIRIPRGQADEIVYDCVDALNRLFSCLGLGTDHLVRVIDALFDLVHVGGAEFSSLYGYRVGDVLQNDRSVCLLVFLKPVEIRALAGYPLRFFVCHKASVSRAGGGYPKGDKLTGKIKQIIIFKRG